MNKTNYIGKICLLICVQALIMLAGIGAAFLVNEGNVQASVSGNTAPVGNNSSVDDAGNPIRTGYIYTGDSRIRRLNLTIGMSKMKDSWVYCKSGMGYSWFTGSSIDGINSTMEEHPEIDNWVIVSGWGVNDLWNMNTYLSKYKELLYNEWSSCRLYLMSVNPVGSWLSARYGRISAFNSGLKNFVKANSGKSNQRVFYIDTNATMRKKGFSTIDGLHYSEATNRLIYSTIHEKLDKAYANISNTELAVNIHAKRKLVINDVGNTVNWVSSDENIVKIAEVSGTYTQKAMIEAVATGNAVITADMGVKKLRCRVSVGDDKTLVAYFSYSGEAEYAAECVHDYVGGDLYEIDTVKAYSNDQNVLAGEMAYELDNNLRPMLIRKLKDITGYNTVYIGYPVWNGYAPRAVCTFADSFDWTGKALVPFSVCYNTGSTDSVKELQALMPGSRFAAGHDMKIDEVYESKARNLLLSWLEQIHS